jgi:hypothetical protein
MKITKIENEGNIFKVTKNPNLLQRIFGLKTKVENYKDTGNTYHYFESVHVYINQKGQVLGPINKMTNVLENWRRSF